MSFDVNGLVKEPRHRKNNSLLLLCMLGAQKLYGQLDVGNATYSFDGLRADAKAAHLRKGVIGAKRVRHGGGGGGGDALVVHPVKEEDEITANDDNGGGGNSDDGTMLETAADAALIQRRRRRRRRRRQKADDRGEGRHLRCKLESAG